MSAREELDPKTVPGWRIAEEAEARLKTPDAWRSELGLEPDEILPTGRVAKLHFPRIAARLAGAPRGRFVEVTAITPTPLGEGKTTTSIGLIQGLGRRGVRVGGCLRQPSSGPTLNVKGTAAGGGLSTLIPMTDLATAMVKTHLSLSHDPATKNAPTGWTLPVRDLLIYAGARFVCHVTGAISLMPGTGTRRRVSR